MFSDFLMRWPYTLHTGLIMYASDEAEAIIFILLKVISSNFSVFTEYPKEDCYALRQCCNSRANEVGFF